MGIQARTRVVIQVVDVQPGIRLARIQMARIQPRTRAVIRLARIARIVPAPVLLPRRTKSARA